MQDENGKKVRVRVADDALPELESVPSTDIRRLSDCLKEIYKIASAKHDAKQTEVNGDVRV
jgi:hypothetical protein